MKSIGSIILIIGVLLTNELVGQVVFNEIHMRAAGSSTSSNPQNLADCTPNSGGEFIELYNPDPCASVDISCFIIANNIAGTSASAQGAFRFPTGTIIPPLGFISIGGAHSGATFILNNYCGTSNLATYTSGRWYLPNGDGYLMLYNSSGSPIDAVYWTTDGNAAKWGTDSDINTNPTLIPSGTGGCALVTSLSGPANLPIAAAEHIGVASGAGLSSSRQTDGSLTWVSNASNTINSCNSTCNVPTSFTISSNVSQPTCGSTNGSISLTPNPAGTYTYIWTPNVSTTNSASNLASGSYQIEMSDGSCTWDTTITLTAPTPFTVSANVSQPTCGSTNGSISLTPNPGGTYTYTWIPNVSTTNSASNLVAGSYQIEVSDGSCSWDSTIVLNSPTGCGCLNPLVLSVDSSANTVCNGTSTPCNYSGPNIVFNEIRINPGSATNSIGTVAGTANGLEYIELYNPNPCEAIDLSCYILAGNNNSDNKSNWTLRFPAGTVVAPLGFLTIAGDNVLGADIYPKDFVVAGAWDNINFISADPAAAWLMNGSDWKALYEPNGTPVAGLAWSFSIDNISYINSSSNYNATPTLLNNAGCPTSSPLVSIRTMYNSGTVPVDFLSGIGTGVWARAVDGTGAWTFNSNINSATVSSCNSVCAPPQPGGTSSCNGTATVSVTSGGTNPLSYQWNDPLNQTTATADSLCPGVYCVTVTDASGLCIENVCVEVLDESNLTVTANVSQLTCGSTNGSISLTPNPAGTYTYTWTPNVSTTNSASNLAAGSYQIEVSDGSCTWDTTIILTAPTPFTVSSNVSQPTCGSTNGSISLTPNPAGTYTYTWTPNVSTTNSASNLAAGSYQIEVSDGSCTWDTTITLTAPAPFTISSNVSQPTCGSTNGSISLTPNPAGTYTYTWTPNVSTTNSASNLVAGSYQIEVSDGSCTWDTTITLTAPTPFTVSSNVSQPTCGSTNGNISLTPNPAGTYTYTWIPNVSTTNSASNLASGSYQIEVSDGSCTWNTTITLTASAPFTVTANVNQPTCGSTNGSISLTPNPGGTYTYTWIPNVSTTNSASNLVAGSYQVEVSDGSCTWDSVITTVNLGILPIANFDYLITDSTCSLSGITNNLSISGSTYTWLIDNQFYTNSSIVEFDFNDSEQHTIELVATSSDGCTDSKELVIDFELFDAPVFVPNVFTPNNTDGMNDFWQVISDSDCIEEFECIIFNRWGNKLYTIKDINDKWDGTYNGKEVPQGVYVYVLTIKKNLSRKITKHGHITKL